MASEIVQRLAGVSMNSVIAQERIIVGYWRHDFRKITSLQSEIDHQPPALLADQHQKWLR